MAHLQRTASCCKCLLHISVVVGKRALHSDRYFSACTMYACSTHVKKNRSMPLEEPPFRCLLTRGVLACRAAGLRSLLRLPCGRRAQLQGGLGALFQSALPYRAFAARMPASRELCTLTRIMQHARKKNRSICWRTKTCANRCSDSRRFLAQPYGVRFKTARALIQNWNAPHGSQDRHRGNPASRSSGTTPRKAAQ